jgi:hypothetical protein
MSIGLFRMHLEADSVYAWGPILWKQVRGGDSLCFEPPNLLIVCSKGLIWLIIATLAAVPPVVRLAVLFCALRPLITLSRHRCSCA